MNLSIQQMDNEFTSQALMKLKTLKYKASMTNKAILKFGCGIVCKMHCDAQKVMSEEEV